ncbi:MAG: hypothetical protein H6605_03915 [Flavobacteriales bacterium]|nr:hypothetical protein [Flavobacteriales bacterium]
MKKINLLSIVTILLVFAACQKESTPVTSVKNDDPVVKEKSKLELLCNKWTLKETYTDGVLTQKNGMGQYWFDRENIFNFYSNGEWTGIGTYYFINKDSTSFSLYLGTTTGFDVKIKSLTENELKTEFVTGGKTLNYNYVR